MRYRGHRRSVVSHLFAASLLVFALLNIFFSPNALAVLSEGDLAVVGFNTDSNEVAIVALADISAGETVFITDQGWDDSTNLFTTSTSLDGIITWTTPSMTAGDIITFQITAASTVGASITGGGSTGAVVVSGWTFFTTTDLHGFGSGGDTLIIYQGSTPNPSFIFAFNGQSDFACNPSAAPAANSWCAAILAASISGSTEPESGGTPLSSNSQVNLSGSNTTGQHQDNNVYSGATGATDKAGWLTRISTEGNWSQNDTTAFDLDPDGTGDLPAGGFNVSTPVSDPQIAKAFSPTDIVVGATSTLTFTLTNTDSGSAITNLAFTDSFPSGVEIAATPNIGGSCNSNNVLATHFTPNLAAGGTAVNLVSGSGYGLAASGACTITVDVTPTTTGVKNNTTGALTSTETPTSTDTGSDTLTVTINRILTVDGTGTGNGSTVGTAPSTISCTSTAGVDSGTCANTVTDGTVVVLTATASAGSTFTGWSGCDSAVSNVCTQTVSGGNETVQPNFELNRTMTVDGTGTGNGSTVGTAPSTISCTSTAGVDTGTCANTVTDGTVVVLTATASAGSTFTAWSGCDSAVSNVCTQTVSGGNETVQPNFDLITAPEINVERPALTTILDTGTDAQGSVVAGVQQTLTYTVRNTGTATLNVTNITSSSPSNVTVDSIPTTSFTVSSGGGTQTFTVLYTVTGAGSFSFELDITNDDADEGNYDITVSGTGTTAPEIDVQRPAGTSIINGGSDSQGSVTIGVLQTLTYTIENTGNATLNVSTIAISNPSGSFSPSSLTPITFAVAASGGTQTFDLDYTVTGTGAYSFDIEIDNDDSDEDPYVISVSGTGSSAGSPGSGDPDNDGDADILDARICLQIAEGVITGTTAEQNACDVNGDSSVTAEDAEQIAEFAIGLRNSVSALGILAGLGIFLGIPILMLISRKRRPIMSISLFLVGLMIVMAGCTMFPQGTTALLASVTSQHITVTVLNMPDGGLASMSADAGGFTFNPHIISVDSIQAVAGFELLASQIDNTNGEVRFGIANATAGVTSGSILVMKISLKVPDFSPDLAQVQWEPGRLTLGSANNNIIAPGDYLLFPR